MLRTPSLASEAHSHDPVALPTLPASWLRQINPTDKISFNLSGKSLLQNRPSHPARGAYRDRHERGMGCGGRGSVGAPGDRRASKNS